MNSKDHILAIDEGTTSARAIILDHEGVLRGAGQFSFSQVHPAPGWVEQSPLRLWSAQIRSIKTALKVAGINLGRVTALGITNQRETTLLWERRTGRPVYNAIGWQCRRTADLVEELKGEYGELFREKTGLILDSYFSGPKVTWLLDNVPGLRERAERGEILFGTIDSYLIYRLTGGRVHATDYSNASRTLMFDIRKLEWDSELLEILRVPESILPETKPSCEVYGYTDPKVLEDSIPISGVLGDQQAALFGHAAFREGESKCTFGTGNFLLMNTGPRPVQSRKLLTTVAWSLGGKVTYALEGSIFVTGAAIQWLRDSLKILKSPSESGLLADRMAGNDGVYFVPAFTGLGAPYWDQYARGVIVGITGGTTRSHLARAALEASAYLTRDVVEAMKPDSQLNVERLMVDGGLARNDFLMQFQADILGFSVVRRRDVEVTARGAAYMAGLAISFWKSLDELRAIRAESDEFKVKMDENKREALYGAWKAAVERSLSWARMVENTI